MATTTTVIIDPSEPIDIHALFDTPLRINVEFLFRLPNQPKWVSFYSAKVGEEVPSQDIRTSLTPVPKGTTLLLTMVFSGARNTGYRTAITLSQKNAPLCADIPITGSTGAKLSKYEEVEVDCT